MPTSNSLSKLVPALFVGLRGFLQDHGDDVANAEGAAVGDQRDGVGGLNTPPETPPRGSAERDSGRRSSSAPGARSAAQRRQQPASSDAGPSAMAVQVLSSARGLRQVLQHVVGG